MKTLFYTTVLLVFSAFTTSQTLASRTESLTATAYASQYCQGDAFADMCFRQVKDRAEDNAKRDLDFQCRMKQGTLSFYGYCSTYCSPSFPRPGQNEYVNCNARCTYNCDIR